MRVLHIIAVGREAPGEALEAAESLIASMASLGTIEVGQLHLGLVTGRDGGAEPGVHAVLAEVVAADVLVLTVPASGEITEGLRRLADLLRGPEARMARAADRRTGHRVTRRLVVVAARAGSGLAGSDRAGSGETGLAEPALGESGLGESGLGEPGIGALLALVRDSFRVLDVTESGLISGQSLDSSPGPRSGPRGSSARTWTGHRDGRPAAS